MLHAAVITRGQLRTLENDTMLQEGTERLNKTPLIMTNPDEESLSEKGVDKPTSEATLNKDAADHKMTDLEYLM